MTSPFSDEFVRATAAEYFFEPEALRAALERAYEEYQGDITAYRAPFIAAIPHLERVLRAAERTRRIWRMLPEPARDQFAEHMGDKAYVESRLEDIVAELEDYKVHYGRGRGNPGRARSKKDINLRPFVEFTWVLREFWTWNCDRPFGHELEEVYELGDPEDGDSHEYRAMSRGIAFLHDCALQINPDITLNICRTLVRATRPTATADT